jgi:hypothetical protein
MNSALWSLGKPDKTQRRIWWAVPLLAVYSGYSAKFTRLFEVCPAYHQQFVIRSRTLDQKPLRNCRKNLDDLADAGNLNQATVKEAVDEVVETVAPNSTFDLPKTWRSAKGVTGKFSAGAPDRSPVGSHRDTRLYYAYWNMNHWSNCYR